MNSDRMKGVSGLRLVALCIIMTSMINIAYGQKRKFEIEDIGKNEQKLVQFGISNDLRYLRYREYDEKMGSQIYIVDRLKKDTLQFPGYFTKLSSDGKYIFHPLSSDTISIIKNSDKKAQRLHLRKPVLVPSVKGDVVIGLDKNSDLLMFKVGETPAIRDTGIIDFACYNDRLILLLKHKNQDSIALELRDFKNFNKLKETNVLLFQKQPGLQILAGNGATRNLCFSFLSKDGNREFYAYTAFNGKMLLLNTVISRVTIPQTHELNNISNIRYSLDGTHLFFNLPRKRAKTSNVPIVWSYLDRRLVTADAKQSGYFSEDKDTFSLRLEDGEVLQLDSEFETLRYPRGSFTNDTLMMIGRNEGKVEEAYWNKFAKEKYFAVNTVTGNRRPLPTNYGDLSPNCRFYIYYDERQKDFFAVDFKASRTFNLTKGVSDWMISSQLDVPGQYTTYPIDRWSKDGEGVYLYDRYDIWFCPLTADSKPVCITAKAGKSKNMIFRFIKDIDEMKIVVGQDLMSKDRGFYKLTKNSSPVPLYTGRFYIEERGDMIARVGTTKYFTVPIQNTSEPQNYYLTSDFEHFERLTQNKPNRNTSWLTSTVENWKKGDSLFQGVLYKPESFDIKKRYPVVIYYYEKLSDEANNHKFLLDGGHGTISIPLFTSNDYLILTVDINFEVGHPRKSATRYLLSAYQHLSQMPFVDTTKIGIQGHSFGGYLTNLIITQTDKFAAACSAAGASNSISDNGLVSHGGQARMRFYEDGQMRLGKSLWDAPALYLENSPVILAKNVKTPLLMIHNEKDALVPFSQSMEFFLSLRRLSKRVWLIDYPDENHATYENKNVLDLNLRMLQFFDHYLKNKPAPIWMTRSNQSGIANIVNTLNYDNQILTPGPGLVNNPIR